MPRYYAPMGRPIAPLVLGGNMFGWTIDARASAQVLDRFVDAGLNAIDTAEDLTDLQ